MHYHWWLQQGSESCHKRTGASSRGDEWTVCVSATSYGESLLCPGFRICVRTQAVAYISPDPSSAPALIIFPSLVHRFVHLVDYHWAILSIPASRATSQPPVLRTFKTIITMGMSYRRYLTGARIYGCSTCRTHLATIHSMMSRVRNSSLDGSADRRD